MSDWNFADLWETCATALVGHVALQQGSRTIEWRELDRRANGVAATMLAAGARHQDKVAQYLHNRPEYHESLFATMKAGLVPVNTNYRYTDDELAYLWENADAFAVVFEGVFAPIIDRIRDRVPVRLWLYVEDGTGQCPDWAVPYESAAAIGTATAVRGPWGRSGSDQWFLYTGGTTGRPKGTMWEQNDLAWLLIDTPLTAMPADLDELHTRLTKVGAGPVCLPVAPLMHGTGQFTSSGQLSVGGRVVFCEARSPDPAEICRIITDERVNTVIAIGDVMTRPILTELDSHRGDGTYDISSLNAIVSSGVMWSDVVKKGLLTHHPGMMLFDSLGSSEAIGLGKSVATGAGDDQARTAQFELGDHAAVITEDGTIAVPGSGLRGRLAVKGHIPVGYYKDPVKTAATFVVVDGVRYSIPGDWAVAEPDGTITLLGRGSQVVNTGGEKVFPEEVEEMLKLHPAVRDAAVVGIPDDRFGEAVTALIDPEPGTNPSLADLHDHLKGRLAGYKAPRHLVVVDTLGRAPNGKLDYVALRKMALDRLGDTPNL